MSDRKAHPEDPKKDPHPGMMGDETMEQNLGQTGNPAARITEAEVKQAFDGDKLGKDKGKPRPV